MNHFSSRKYTDTSFPLITGSYTYHMDSIYVASKDTELYFEEISGNNFNPCMDIYLNCAMFDINKDGWLTQKEGITNGD